MKIFFRPDEDTQEEYEIAKEVLGNDCIRYISQIEPGDTIIGRYSVLPFYKYVEEEVKVLGSKLINTYEQHKYIANMEWANNTNIITPNTWFNYGWQNVPDTEYGYIVKGRTNSRKFRWHTHMFAPDRMSLKNTMNRLYDDGFIADQGLVIREYIPLETFEIGINGMPMTNEYRFFFMRDDFEGDQIEVASGFYWSNSEAADEKMDIPIEAKELALQTAREVSLPVVVIDVARTVAGKWIVIELNDFQMSGLSTIDPAAFYEKLKIFSDKYLLFERNQ